MVSLIVPLFTSAFRHAETLSLAIGCPLLSWGQKNRTRLKDLAYAKRDLGGLLYLLCGTALVVATDVVLTLFWRSVAFRY